MYELSIRKVNERAFYQQGKKLPSYESKKFALQGTSVDVYRIKTLNVTLYPSNHTISTRVTRVFVPRHTGWTTTPCPAGDYVIHLTEN